MSTDSKYPNQARFAFTVVDDTDNATTENVAPVYQLLTSLGVRITKTVWVYPPRDRFRGECLLDETYLDFVKKLQLAGHEIALHNVGSGSFSREEILKGLELFRELLGHYPRLHANHVSNPDNLYWRAERRFLPPVSWIYTGVRWAMKVLLRRPMTMSSGESEDSPHFWGDAALQHIRYVRNLTFCDLDTIANDPRMPYHDPRKPFVKCWFSSSDGNTVDHFNDLIRKENVDRLEAREGAAIVYTHFTNGFIRNGAVDPTFAERMRQLAGRRGWFAPASEVLDRLSELRCTDKVKKWYLRGLELRWFGQRVANYIRYHR